MKIRSKVLKLAALAAAVATMPLQAQTSRSGGYSAPISRPATVTPRPTTSFNQTAPMPTFRPAAPRPSTSFNQVAPAPRPAPSLSRPFYIARDGYPLAKHGFQNGKSRGVVLQPGTIIGRKGNDAGAYATRSWQPKPGALGLEPKADRAPMRFWRVKRPLNATTGKAAPWWGARGGGSQLLLRQSVRSLVGSGGLARTIGPNFRMAARRH